MKKRLLSIMMALIAMIIPTNSWAQTVGDETAEPYAVLSQNNTVLTFYYDENKAARNGMDINNSYINNNSPYGTATTAVIDASFVDYWPTNTAYWFMNCSSLTSITGMENLKTDNVTNMHSMFWGCSGLTSLDVSHFNTQNVTNMGEMFYDCSSLTSLDVSGFKTDNVEDMGFMFGNCSSLTSLDVSHFNTQNVTGMYGMFWGCSGLTSLDVSHFNTQSVTTMTFMFYSCSSLTSLDVTNFDTQKVTDMSHMFGFCSSLTSLDVTGFKTDNVISMTSMFDDCSKLTNIDVTGFKTNKVTNMNRMFGACHSLTSIDVSGFNTENVTDMEGMFAGCSSLSSLNLHNFKTDNVTSMRGMFYGCSNLTSLDLSNLKTGNVTDMGMMFTECSSLTSLDVTNFKTDNVTDMEKLFESCSGLTSLDLSNFNTAKVSDMTDMFIDCSVLTTIYAGSNWSTATVITGGYMFSGCTHLVGGAGTKYDATHTDYTYAHIDGGANNPGYFTAKSDLGERKEELRDMITQLQHEVQDCERQLQVIQSGDISYLIQQLDDIKKAIVDVQDKIEVATTEAELDECEERIYQIAYKLEELRHEIDNYNVLSDPEPYAVLSQNNTVLTFYYDENKAARNGMDIEEYTLWWDSEIERATTYSGWDDERENITNVVFDASFANCTTLTSTAFWFYGFTSLTSITGITNLKTDNMTDIGSMFENCSSLTSIDISRFNTSKVTNMSRMFSGCSSLTSLDLRGFNTTNVIYFNAMFLGCSALTNLDLSNFNTANAKNMSELFEGCSGLTTLNVIGFKTDNVTSMGYMFYRCSGLTSLDLSNFNTGNVISMNFMFYGCSNLTSLDLSNFNTGNVDSMAEMFHFCSGLTTIYVGDGWSTEKLTNGGWMFDGCTRLVGGRGTRYDPDHVNADYAHIDGGTANPGYFTAKRDLGERKEELMNKIYSLMQEVDVCNKELEIKDPDRTSNLWKNLNDIKTAIDDVASQTENATTEEELDDCEDYILQIAYKLEELRKEIENYNPIHFSFDGLTAWVSGGATLDDAFAEAGVRAEAAKTIAAIIWENTTALTADMLQGISNPNLLVYVNEARLAPQGVQNVVINGIAKEIILTDATSGNNNFFCPQLFMAERISYTRNFRQQTEIGISRGWEGIALPFDVQTITHETKGTITPFGLGNSKHFWLRAYDGENMYSAHEMEAYAPYVIAMPNSSAYYADYNLNGRVTFSATNTEVYETPDFSFLENEPNMQLMTIPAFQTKARSERVYAINVGQARGNHAEGSVFEQNLREVRPFEVYTVHNGQGARPRFIPIKNQTNGESTGIVSMENGEWRIENGELRMENDGWFGLDGRKLSGEPQKKGVYIQKGKKIMVK